MPERSKVLNSGILAVLATAFALHSGMARASAPSLGLLWSLTGCADSKGAGGDCPEVTYLPTGMSPYADSNLRSIIDACRPDEITSWSISVDGPELSDACMNAILDVLPLDVSFRTGTVGAGVTARENVTRAFHAILFTPLFDTGDIFGSTSSDDYCPSIYGDYLAAPSAISLEPRDLNVSDYDSGISAVNAFLFRFILERTSKIRFVKGDGSFIAKEVAGDIQVSTLFAEQDNPITMAAILVHESRHNATGFGDGSNHVDCVQGQSEGTPNCDDTMFGAYGAGLSYVDAALKGSLLTRLADGTPWLSELQAMDLLNWACTYYQNSINDQTGDLADRFGTDMKCGDVSSNATSFFEEQYGIPTGTIEYRE